MYKYIRYIRNLFKGTCLWIIYNSPAAFRIFRSFRIFNTDNWATSVAKKKKTQIGDSLSCWSATWFWKLNRLKINFKWICEHITLVWICFNKFLLSWTLIFFFFGRSFSIWKQRHQLVPGMTNYWKNVVRQEEKAKLSKAILNNPLFKKPILPKTFFSVFYLHCEVLEHYAENTVT